MVSFEGWIRRPAENSYDKAEFADFFNTDRSDLVGIIGSSRYYLKFCDSPYTAQKSLLTYRLVGRLMNVPSITLPHPGLKREIVRMFRAPAHLAMLPPEVLLVRLCQDYRLADLPIQNLTEAIAAELVLSAWINRRDMHNSNRVYVDGVPMFFDFDAGFGPDEPPHEFLRPGSDAGYVPNWRLWTGARQPLGTTAIRTLERSQPYALQPVHDLSAFWTALDGYSNRIGDMTELEISEASAAAIDNVGLAAAMTAYLLDERGKLAGKLARIRTILEADIIDRSEAELLEGLRQDRSPARPRRR